MTQENDVARLADAGRQARVLVIVTRAAAVELLCA
jgi:hypothetical protein